MQHNCNLCNYSTNRLYSYNKHLQTKKHVEKVNNETKYQSHTKNTPLSYLSNTDNLNKCVYCGKKYSNSSSLARHKKVCSEKNQLETKYISEINKKEQEITHLKEIIDMLKNENKNFKSLVNNAGAVIKTSVSALAYVALNYDKAPLLKGLNDYSYIKEQNIDDDNDDDDDGNSLDEFDLIEILVYHNKKETIQDYLGNIIVEAYKKKDPRKQSIWNSDTTRLTYIIRDLIHKKPDWTVDKKGIKTSKYIIEPLLEYIREQLAEYVLENTVDKYVNLSEYKLKQHMERINSCGQIIANIDNKTLSKLVLKYIAPHFYLAKSEKLIEAN